jgi:hypothetical protein
MERKASPGASAIYADVSSLSEARGRRRTKMGDLNELVASFEAKLQRVRDLINAYEEGMDYVSHCTLQGFAEGLEFAIEEMKKHAS